MSSVWKLHLYCSLFLSFLDLQASLKWWHGEMPRQFRETEMPKCLGPRCWAYKKTLQHWLTAFATASTWNFVKSGFTVSRYQGSYDSERGHDCYESGQIAMENSHNSSFSRKTLGECNLQLLILRNLNPSPFRVHKLSHPWRAICLKKEAISCPHTPWLLTIQYQPDQPFPDTFLRLFNPAHVLSKQQKCRCVYASFSVVPDVWQIEWKAAQGWSLRRNTQKYLDLKLQALSFFG